MRKATPVAIIMIWILMSSSGMSTEIQSTDTSLSHSTPIEISGTLSAQYQGRYHGSENDNDMSQSLYLNMDGLWDGNLSAALAMRFYENLDNYDTYRSNSTYYTYEGISDSYSSRNRSNLYYAYFDIKNVLGPDRVRIGRQYLYQVEFVHFDGASLYWEDWHNMDIEIFGGKPVSYYSNTDGRATFGGKIDYHPVKYGSVGIEYMRYSQDSYDNDYLAFNSKQYIGNNIKFFETFTFLDSKSRDFQWQGIYYIPSKGLSLNATYYHQIQTLQDYSDQYSAYYQAIGDYYPFHLISLAAYKELGPRMTLNGGVTYRVLNDSSDESEFNRQYQLYFAGVTFRDVAIRNLDLSFTFQHWEIDSYTASSIATLNSNPNDTTNQNPDEVEVFYNVPSDKTDTISAELQYKWNKKNKLQIGTDYQKYKYNYDTNEELENVRTYYMKWRWQMDENWQFYTKLQVEKQSSDPDEFYKVVSSLMYSF